MACNNKLFQKKNIYQVFLEKMRLFWNNLLLQAIDRCLVLLSLCFLVKKQYSSLQKIFY